MLLVNKLVVGEWHLDTEDADEAFLASLVIVVLDDVDNAVPDGVGDVHTYALTHKGVATLLIYHGTLLVHHVVVF